MSIVSPIFQLRKSVAYSIALEKGWLTAAEKLFALKQSGLWDTARKRDQVDLLMAAGCYEEAIPLYTSFAHWRKVGDALFGLGRFDEARDHYEKGANTSGEQYQAFRKGPDRDRLIALAVSRNDWAEALEQVRRGAPEPFLTKDVIFGGSSRAKAPLLKLFAHAAARNGTSSAIKEMQSFFGITFDEAKLFLDHAHSDAYAKDIAKLAKPPLTRISATSLETALASGRTDRSRDAVSYLSSLNAGLAEAVDNLSRWKSSRSHEVLDQIVYWLAQSRSFEIFKSCLFALQCEQATYGRAESWEVDFYTAHPWLTRAGMRELLKALVAQDDLPNAEVLLCCAFQHSASPCDLSNIDLEYSDPLVQIRSQPSWAESVIAKWQKEAEFPHLWHELKSAMDTNGFGDLRQTSPFKVMAIAMSTALQTAWKLDFEHIRWKAEHSTFLMLKSLLPNLEIVQHASPVWLSPQHLDIFIPPLRLAIEYQGEQHFRPIAIFGGNEGFEATKRRDDTKNRLCALAGVQLEYICFDEDLETRLRQIAKMASTI